MVKSTTWLGPTAPITLAAAFQPGPLLPSKLETTCTSAARAKTDALATARRPRSTRDRFTETPVLEIVGYGPGLRMLGT